MMSKESNWRKYKKVELHRHLEGAVRLSTILDVADDAGVRLPTRNIEELKNHALVLKPMKDLSTVLNCFWLVQSCLATPKILERISYENVIDAYNDGIRVLELRYSPGFISANHPNLNYDLIHKSIMDGIDRAVKELKNQIVVGVICIISRDQPEKEAVKTTDFTIANKSAFIGFDLAGDEASFKCTLFKKYFDKVRASGLGITVHSGEARVPGAAQYVKDSIVELGAQRIGHGLLIIHDEKIINFVKEKNVVLELCPTSNYLTKAIDHIQDHPIKKLRDLGVRVTLNSDDPHLFGIDLTHEYDLLEKELHFTKDDFDKLTAEALRASFISQDKIKKVWQQ